MLKVVREAKVNTSWVSPNEAYEAALAQFVDALFVEKRRRPFLNHLDEFARKIAEHGR
jgi:(1->4)-alpha-D-glucan 1-alpha-D-glucosylmutase